MTILWVMKRTMSWVGVNNLMMGVLSARTAAKISLALFMKFIRMGLNGYVVIVMKNIMITNNLSCCIRMTRRYGGLKMKGFCWRCKHTERKMSFER